MKIVIILGICIGSIAVALAVFLAVLFRYGFMNLKADTWIAPEMNGNTEWDDIFSEAQDFAVSVYHCGDVIAESGSRPYVRQETIPDGYPVDFEETLPVIAFSFRHPLQGDILIDTGLNGSFHTDPPYGDLLQIMQAYQKDNRYRYSLAADTNIGYRLEYEAIQPRYVLMTHLHPDHAAGLIEIDDEATVLINSLENIFYYKMLNGPYLKGKDIKTLDFAGSSSIGPFEQVIDIFGDMSVFAIATPGHTVGHISYLINNKDQPILVLGDLQVSSRFQNEGIETSVDPKDEGVDPLHESIRQFNEFILSYPQVRILYPHEMPLE